LKQRADVNVRQADGATALHWAAHWNDLGTADLLIRAGARVNSATDLGVTPLYLAAEIGSGTMVEKLLAAGADANALPATGVSPLMVASRAGSLQAAAALLAHEANANTKENAQAQTALMWAVAQKHADVVALLIKRGADVHARTKSTEMLVVRGDPAQVPSSTSIDNVQTGGSTPLFFAARNGDIDCARLLLDGGADVNERAADGNSVLVLAAHSGHRAFAAFLLEKGADPNANGAGYTALHAAVLRGDVELAKSLLSHGANPNAAVLKATPMRRNSIDVYIHASLVGATPLVMAAKYAAVDMIRTLVAGGSDLETSGRDSASPLIVAANANRQGQPGDLGAVAEPETLEAVKVLLELGANVSAVNRTADTALHVASTRGFNNLIQLLVEKGARLDMKNDRGQTPLAIASARPQLKSTADLLRKLGAEK
jgi:uncharacterized protein